jgi:HlyD family secretion protein
MKRQFIYTLLSLTTLLACDKKIDYDASGNFEADEVIVSARQNGQLLSLTMQEGDVLKENQYVGQIDVTLPELQKQQAEATMTALNKKTSSADEQTKLAGKQLAVQQARLDQLQKERARTDNLVRADAATRKQLDDINAAIEQLNREIAATHQQIKLYQSNVATQNRAILSESGPLMLSAKQFQEQIDRGRIINPVAGTVLSKYALKGEMTAVGKPLYKVANMDTLTLKAYTAGEKLGEIKTGQQVTVRIDDGKDQYKKYTGTITWISAKSEFTPKTIQTKNERANLVYALKVRVKNDGYLKIGMYGEALFKQNEKEIQ